MTKEEKTIIMRMDKKLWEQLAKYSQANDLSIAQSARKAIKLFLKGK
jgi:hypothetical protein